jgi:hypothetical protein
MVEENGIVASTMYTERVMKVRIPIESEEDPLKIFEETRKRFGRKMTMKDIEKLLED